MPRNKKPKTDYEWLRQKREHGGSIRERNGQLYARIQFIGDNGRMRDKERPARNRKHARELIKQMRKEHEVSGEVMLDAHRMTFADLAREYEKSKLFPAKPDKHGRKIAGVRSYPSLKSNLRRLLEHFGRKHIRTIRYGDIEAYKRIRLETPVSCGRDKNGKPLERERSITSVNREVELLRAMLRYAVRDNYLIMSPFQSGGLISKASENQRERVLMFDEERRLLEACGDRTVTYTRCTHKRGMSKIAEQTITAKDKGENRAYLRALIIAAIDTGARRGELFQLTWSDVDFQTSLIRIRAATTKKEKARAPAMTPRVREELLALRNRKDAPKNDTALVFGITHTIKYAWASLLDQAKIEDLHFHDLRHTFVTRMIRAGVPMAEVMKISGHSPVSFARYLNPGSEAALKGAELLSQYQSVHEVRPSDLLDSASTAVN